MIRRRPTWARKSRRLRKHADVRRRARRPQWKQWAQAGGAQIRLALASSAVVALLLAAHASGWYVGTYGQPGSPNGGVYVSRVTTCDGWGVELWGHPGPFAQLDC